MTTTTKEPNKTATAPQLSPEQLREKADRDLLLNGLADFDAKFPPATPEQIVGKVLQRRTAEPGSMAEIFASVGREFRDPGEDDDSDPFQWNGDNEDMIVAEQRALAAYRNRFGQVVLRAEAGPDDHDTFICINPEYVPAVIERLQKLLAETRR